MIQAGDMPAALAQLRRKGVYTVAAALQRSRPLSQVTGPFTGGVAVVIGNEGQASPRPPLTPATPAPASP